MPIYTIIGGVNGAGKSSLTGVLKSERSDLGSVIDVDKIAAENNCGNLEAGKIAVAKINGFLQKGVSFTQETTLSGHRTEVTVRKALGQGYTVRLFYVGLNAVQESVKRIKNRVEKGGHDIPDDDVERRFETRFESLAAILPYCHEVHFYDNENGFAEVAEYRNGELLPIGNYRPKWLSDLADALARSTEQVEDLER